MLAVIILSLTGHYTGTEDKPVKDVLGIWRQLYADGIAQPGSKDEQGPTWVSRFKDGKVGVAPMPSTTLALMESAGIKVGVIPIPGPDGGQSTFVGGDVVGIASTTTKADAAWNFLAWQLRRLLETSVWYAGRAASASPAVGSLAMHKKEQQLIIQDAFTLG